MKVYYEMWRTHLRFIQDTLQFTYHPVHTLDTFYFERAVVEQKTKNKGKYLIAYLMNKNYGAIVPFNVTDNANQQDIPLYKMLLNLKRGMPVLAVLNLKDITLSDNDIDKGSEMLMLNIELNSVYQTK